MVLKPWAVSLLALISDDGDNDDKNDDEFRHIYIHVYMSEKLDFAFAKGAIYRRPCLPIVPPCCSYKTSPLIT